MNTIHLTDGDVRSKAGIVTAAELSRLSYRLSVGTDAAPDLQQEAYLRLIERPPARPLTRAELFTRARWNMLNAGERRRCWERYNGELTDEVEDCHPAPLADPETLYIQKEEMEARVERLYAQIGHTDCTILNLIRRGYRKPEIARRLGVTRRTVDRRLLRMARLALAL